MTFLKHEFQYLIYLCTYIVYNLIFYLMVCQLWIFLKPTANLHGGFLFIFDLCLPFQRLLDTTICLNDVLKAFGVSDGPMRSGDNVT